MLAVLRAGGLAPHLAVQGYLLLIDIFVDGLARRAAAASP